MQLEEFIYLLHCHKGISSVIFSVKNPPNQRILSFLEDWFRKNLDDSNVMVFRRSDRMPGVTCFGECKMTENEYQRLIDFCEDSLNNMSAAEKSFKILDLISGLLKRLLTGREHQTASLGYRDCLSLVVERMKKRKEEIDWDNDEVVFMLTNNFPLDILGKGVELASAH